MMRTPPDDHRHGSSGGERRGLGVRERLGQLVPGMTAAVTAAVVTVLVTLVLVIVAGGNQLTHSYIATEGKTCGDVEVTGDASLLENYTSCVTIEGNLRIQLIEYDSRTKPNLGLPNLVHVTGYVVIYRLSYLRTLRHLLPRLAVIRGLELFHGYSLVIFGNIFLQEPDLGNLTHILAGAVRVEKNLCRGPPHRWNLISPSSDLNVIQDYGVCVYPMCEEQRNCTNTTTTLHTHCTSYGGCYQGPQCHLECVGGCHVPHDPDACVACRHYRDGNTCVPECSSSAVNKVHHLGYRCIRKDECGEEPWVLKTEVAPYGAERLVCVRCNDNCYGTCHGSKVTTGNLGRQLKNCRRLEGNLEIMVSGGWNLMQQLEENLGQLELVTGYLKVYGSDTLFSLNFLSSLEEIGGEDLVHGRYALYVLDNEKLQELWDWNHRNHSLRITRGMLFFQHNPSLCQTLIHELASRAGVTPATRVHVPPSEDTGPCYTTDLWVSVLPQSDRELNVSWEYHYHGHDDRFVIGYYLYYREAPQAVMLYQGRDACNDNMVWERVFREYERNKGCMVKVDNLKPYTNYAVYVDVYYTDGVKNASRSAIIYATTMVSKPSPVRSLRSVQQENSSTLVLSWLAPAVPNGPLNVYEVKYGQLKRPSPLPQDLDRDNVCEDRKNEPQREASPSVPGGGEVDTEPRCCECPSSAVSLSKEDRLFDRQLDINFENYIVQNLICKRVSDDHGSKSTPTLIGPRKSSGKDQEYRRRESEMKLAAPTTTPTTQVAATQTDEKHQGRKQRLRRSVSNPTTGTPNGNTDNQKAVEEEECETDKGSTSQEAAAAVCHMRNMTTTTTSLSLTGLRYFTSYRVWVRACHYNESDCGDWAVLEVTTPSDMSIYTIKNFVVKEVNMNETKQLPATETSNSNDSTTTTTPSPRHSAPTGATLLLSWERPPVSRGDALAYIIRYKREEAPEKKECVSENEAYLANYTFALRGLKFATYTLQIKLRTRSGDGPPTTLTVHIKGGSFNWTIPIAFLCGGMLGIVIMEVALWLKRRRTAEEPEGAQPTTHNPSYGELLLKDTLKHLEEGFVIANDALQVELENKLGAGFFGQVYRGVLTLSSREERLVAVKTLSEQATHLDVKRFLQEAVVMQGIKSNFVVRLIGVVNNFPPIYVVMELMERGDLKTFLRKEAGSSLTEEKMVEMAVEAADGMAYLEAKKLVHRDLAARNCMLDKGLTLKIGDFGLTRYVMTDYYKKQSRGLLPVRWMAPESLKYGRYSARSDVWSYGVFLWELATGGLHPYEGYSDEKLDDFIISGLRLKRPSRGPEFFYPIMMECWNSQPKKRPTFKRLVQRLLPRTSKRYLEYFQGVSFFHSSSFCDSESPDDIDEGFNASGSSQEDAEAEHSRSSSSLPHFHYQDRDTHFPDVDLESQSNEDDIAVDDDLVCLTPEEPYERSSCAPLSCLTGQVGRPSPSGDVPNKTLLFRTPCFAET